MAAAFRDAMKVVALQDLLSVAKSLPPTDENEKIQEFIRRQLPEHLRVTSTDTTDGSSTSASSTLPCLADSPRILDEPLTARPRILVLDVPGWCQQECDSPWPPISPHTVPNRGQYKDQGTFGWIILNDAACIKRILERSPATLNSGNMLQMNMYFREHYQRKPPVLPITYTLPYTPPERPESAYQIYPGYGSPWTTTKIILDQLTDMVAEWQNAHDARRPLLPGCSQQPAAAASPQVEHQRQMFLAWLVRWCGFMAERRAP